jgi:hypothetical protein
VPAAQLRLNRPSGRNVRKGDHHSIDPIVEGAIRHDAGGLRCEATDVEVVVEEEGGDVGALIHPHRRQGEPLQDELVRRGLQGCRGSMSA